MTLWVLKIGTNLLRGNDLISTSEIIDKYCSYIASAIDNGDKIVIVSSGAVGLGCYQLGLNERPQDIVSLQAAASIGQSHLISLYEKGMYKFNYQVAQILLTRSDFSTRSCYQNASRTIKRLIDWNVIPIINENDTVANEELKYGDNDTLSALVATAVTADKLVLLTDIDYLYSANPHSDKNAIPIMDVHHPNELKTYNNFSQKEGLWGTGGIKTKLIAARIATESGIKVHLADGRKPKILCDLFKGSPVGTIFHPHPKPIGNKKSWLAHAIKPIGGIELDEGAREAIESKGASLLLVGIKNVYGEFASNQPVKILTKNGDEIARGITSISSDAIRNALTNPLSSNKSPVVIHRDVLVLINELVD